MRGILELQEIYKSYKGMQVLNNVSLTVKEGSIVALVGKNGSGKSTLLKIMLENIIPDSGVVKKKSEVFKIGYVPEVAPYDIPFTTMEYLLHMGSISGLDETYLSNKIQALFENFQMNDYCNRRLMYLSKGMRQKVLIMQALLEDTTLLILDEPLSGLDFATQKDIEKIFLHLKQRGVSVVFTCHEPELIDRLADEILILMNKQLSSFKREEKQNADEYLLIFDIFCELDTAEIGSFLKIKGKRNSEKNGKTIVEAVVKERNVDYVLRNLLKQEASIKMLKPLGNSGEEFLNYLLNKGGRDN